MKLINLTPHAINFVDGDGNAVLTVAPSGDLARVSSQTVTIGDCDGIPITTTWFGAVVGLPDRQDGTGFIVSSLVAQRVPDRDDVFIPSDSVRDDAGRIIGCRSLGRVS